VTRLEILDRMYRDPDVEQAIQKMNPAELRDDLRQEVFMVLCEMDEERLMSMHQQGYLKFFLVRTMLNMIKSDRSTFYNKFRKPVVEWNERMDKHDEKEEDNTELIAKLNDRMSEIHWYAAKVFELYSQNGKNIMALSRETKIPYRSLFKTIRAVKNLMRQELRKPSSDD
jgi:hypothetical protein